jgi:tripartite-type tricarboxylate transporter receptor subunit TctC
VRVVVPNPPGGSSDVLMRILAGELSARLGQPFVVENRPGAGGNIGVEAALKAPPDGYTLSCATVSQWVINPFLYRSMPFDVGRDIAWISLGWEVANILLVPAAHVPARSVDEFFAWARAQPDPLVFTSPGIGTSAHLLGALVGNRGGFPVTHSPFRGAAEAVPAILRGDAQFAVDNLASWLPLVRAGQVRALAITSAERSSLVPEVPTMAELGRPEFTVTIWGGLTGPAAMPGEAVGAVSGAMQAIATDPAVAARITSAGATLRASTPAAMAERAAHERPFWRDLVKLSGARAD